ncbi:MAG TPA: hypothetical protein VIY72_13990 [Acidimicrobiales bacterium]
MDTNLTTEFRQIRRNRRTARVLGAVAVGAALTAGLVGCGSAGSDDASSNATALKATATVPSDALSDTGVPVEGDATVAPANEPSSSNGGNSNNGGGQPSAPKPVIDSFATPENIDCHNGNFQEFTASWSTTHASKVTISIDGPGVYAEYPADGETSLPFNCNSSHSFLLTAHGEGGTATRTITLDPRNVQGESSDEDEQSMPMGTSAKVSGGSTGTGTASERDCEIMAQQQETLQDIAHDQIQANDFDSAIATLDEADKVETHGYNAGCFFVYT